jgi:hypothetical protein
MIAYSKEMQTYFESSLILPSSGHQLSVCSCYKTSNIKVAVNNNYMDKLLYFFDIKKMVVQWHSRKCINRVLKRV